MRLCTDCTTAVHIWCEYYERSLDSNQGWVLAGSADIPLCIGPLSYTTAVAGSLPACEGTPPDLLYCLSLDLRLPITLWGKACLGCLRQERRIFQDSFGKNIKSLRLQLRFRLRCWISKQVTYDKPKKPRKKLRLR